MIDGFEALKALAERRTMTSAAGMLRITQSAVSKRIAQFEAQLGHQLIEPSGRNVVLTPYAERILKRAGPLLAELKAVVQEEGPVSRGLITIAVSRVVLSSWGSKALAKVCADMSNLELDITVRGGPGSIEQVRSGDCLLGIVRGTGETTPDLIAEFLVNETMVIVPSKLKPFRFPRSGTLSLIGLMAFPEAQQILERRMKLMQARWGLSIEISKRYQSSSVLVALAKAGFGHAVVPLAIARTFGVPANKLVHFPKPGLSVPTSLICRKQTRSRPLVDQFLESLLQKLPRDL